MPTEPPARVAEPAVLASSAAEPYVEPVQTTAKQETFGRSGKETPAPAAPQARQEKPAAPSKVSEPKSAKPGVWGLFGKKTAASATPLARQETTAALKATPQPAPAPRPAQSPKTEEKPTVSAGGGVKSAPVQPEAPAPARKADASRPERVTLTKAALSFMAEDIKKDAEQLKRLFGFGGKK